MWSCWKDAIHIILCVWVCVCANLLQLCPTLCDPHGLYSPPGSSVHGILHARILEWFAMPSSRESSWPRDWTCVSLPLAPPGKPQSYVFPKESPRYCTPREIIHGKETVLSKEETYEKSMNMILERKQDSFHLLVFQWLTTCNRK